MPARPDPPSQLAGIADYCAGRLAEHGPTAEGVGWPSDESHRLRFAKLLQLIEDRARPASVNDLGCGYGALFDVLAVELGDTLERYVGYDISPEMLRAAREHVADRRAVFVESARPTETADYSFASGIFNLKVDAGDEEWGVYVKDTIRALAASSRRGFAFNSLSTFVDWREDHLYYADPAEYFEFCKREVSRFATLLHDYPLYEWTMLVRLEEPAA